MKVFPNRRSTLNGIHEDHPSLDKAFEAIANHLGGTDELNPEMGD